MNYDGFIVVNDSKIKKKNSIRLSEHHPNMSQFQKTNQLTSNLQICRILNGMWQVAGGHGQINPESAISEMFSYHDNGFTTWDMADIYGPAEEYIGEFRRRLGKKKMRTSLIKCKHLQNLSQIQAP